MTHATAAHDQGREREKKEEMFITLRRKTFGIDSIEMKQLRRGAASFSSRTTKVDLTVSEANKNVVGEISRLLCLHCPALVCW